MIVEAGPGDQVETCEQTVRDTVERWGQGEPPSPETVRDDVRGWNRTCGVPLPAPSEGPNPDNDTIKVPDDEGSELINNLLGDVIADGQCTTEGTLAGQADWEVVVAGIPYPLDDGEPGTAEATVLGDDTLQVKWAGAQSDLQIAGGRSQGHYLVLSTAGSGTAGTGCGSIHVPNAPDPDDVLCSISFSHRENLISGIVPDLEIVLRASGLAQSPVCK